MYRKSQLRKRLQALQDNLMELESGTENRVSIAQIQTLLREAKRVKAWVGEGPEAC